MYSEISSNLPNKVAVAVALGVGAVGFSIICRRIYLENSRRRHLTKLVEEKKQKRKSNVDILRRALETPNAEIRAKREEIVNLTFDNLRLSLSSGKYSPIEVLEAFQWKALTANDLTNCVCEFLNEATVWAQELETKYSHSDKKPLLYGIPISVKECNKVRGHDATAGFAQYVNQSSICDSALVAVLKHLGAVPFVLTNVPQCMMSLGCSNPVYGSTCNPYDVSRSCGGSSGGEGALIGLHGSPLGIGTDVGGSVRVPAHFCGICSLKPTVGRLAQSGRRGAMPGLTAIQGTAGPMGIDVDSLVAFMRAVCGPPKVHNEMFLSNPYVAPLVFDEDRFGAKSNLTIGFYDYDNFIQATPACKRAVNVAKQALENAGHTLVPFDPPDVPYLMSLYSASVIPDGGKYLAQTFANDLVDPFHQELAAFFALPLKRKRFFGRLLSFVSSARTAMPYKAYAQTTSELRRVFEQLLAYREKYVNLWLSAGLDCIVCPVLATPAVPIEAAPRLFFGAWNYCALYNALDFPSGVLSVTKVTETDERNLEDYPTADFISRLLKQSSKGAVGLPVGVQVVALPFREEICLRVMKILETQLKQ